MNSTQYTQVSIDGRGRPISREQAIALIVACDLVQSNVNVGTGLVVWKEREPMGLGVIRIECKG